MRYTGKGGHPTAFERQRVYVIVEESSSHAQPVSEQVRLQNQPATKKRQSNVVLEIYKKLHLPLYTRRHRCGEKAFTTRQRETKRDCGSAQGFESSTPRSVQWLVPMCVAVKKAKQRQ